jgi:hypothetical protein
MRTNLPNTSAHSLHTDTHALKNENTHRRQDLLAGKLRARHTQHGYKQTNHIYTLTQTHDLFRWPTSGSARVRPTDSACANRESPNRSRKTAHISKYGWTSPRVQHLDRATRHFKEVIISINYTSRCGTFSVASQYLGVGNGITSIISKIMLRWLGLFQIKFAHCDRRSEIASISPTLSCSYSTLTKKKTCQESESEGFVVRNGERRRSYVCKWRVSVCLRRNVCRSLRNVWLATMDGS